MYMTSYTRSSTAAYTSIVEHHTNVEGKKTHNAIPQRADSKMLGVNGRNERTPK